jgi:eukaryotic-like serine/threonine-protein kinase
MAERLRRLGRYDVERLIGSGAFGEVYLGTLHGAMGFRKRVALKVIGHDRPGLDPRKIGTFVNEARLGETLHHPNIVAIHEFGQEGASYFLAMEFIDGISLRGILTLCAGRGVLLPEDAVCDLGVQVCTGLDHAHNAVTEHGTVLDLIHRDLKPANLMVDRTGTVRIVDFGIARAATNPFFTTHSGEIKGTPRYMAPEQVSADVGLGPAVDIYALGLVLCEMATGEPVYTADSITELIYKVVENDIADAMASLRRTAPALYPVVRKALATKPADRHRSAAAMGDALREAWFTLGGRPCMAHVARATCGLVTGEAASSLTAGETVEATAMVEGEGEPGTWGSFHSAFTDQLGDHPLPQRITAQAPEPAPEPRVEEPPPRTRWPILAAGAAAAGLALLLVGIFALPRLWTTPTPTPIEPATEAVEPATEAPTEPATEATDETPTPTTEEPPTPAPPRVTAPAEPATPPPPVEEPTPEPPPSVVEGTGQIKLNSVPWSHIYLDGTYLGRTGAPSFEVPAGPHTVRLFRQETEQEKLFQIQVQPDATVNVGCWNFSTESPCGS